MRLAMAQMKMTESMEENLQNTLRMMEAAKAREADLVFFPEIQLSPFFPQYEHREAGRWLLRPESAPIQAICGYCRKLGLWASPNVYLRLAGADYDASLMIDSCGEIAGISKMVHICRAKGFYEQDYYAPSDDGFKVYDTPFGKIGIVICFDRHIPGSVRACAKQGAQLILTPTANLAAEPLELFEWEVRVQAFQNTVFMAMCNRVGTEDQAVFAGQSLAAAPDGSLIVKAGSREELICVDLRLDQASDAREGRKWLEF